jgi:hypothetical protein
MAETRADPVACARLIVLGCVRREIGGQASFRSAIGIATIVLACERDHKAAQTASPPQPRPATRSVAITLWSLSCVGVFAWLLVIATIHP